MVKHIGQYGFCYRCEDAPYRKCIHFLENWGISYTKQPLQCNSYIPGSGWMREHYKMLNNINWDEQSTDKMEGNMESYFKKIKTTKGCKRKKT